MPGTAGPAATPAQWLLEIDATSATWDGTSLTLAGTSPSTTAFTDRPQRRAQSMATKGIVARWASMFQGDPPNLAVSGRTDSGPRTWVVTATKAPTWREDGTVVVAARPVTTGTTTGTAPSAGPTAGDVLRDVTVTVDDAVLNIECNERISFGFQGTFFPTMDIDAPAWDQPITVSFSFPDPSPFVYLQATAFGTDSTKTVTGSGTVLTVPAPSTWVTRPAGSASAPVPIDIAASLAAGVGGTNCEATVKVTPT